MSYRLSCIQCPYETVAEGLERAFDLREDHLDEYGEPHFVDFVRVDAADADGRSRGAEADSTSGGVEGD